MEIEMIMEFITKEALIIVPVLWIIGKFLKQTSIKDKYIIWILLAIGVIVTPLYLGPSLETGIQGVLVTGVAVLGHNLLKQSQKSE